MSQFATSRAVWFIEEAVDGTASAPRLEIESARSAPVMIIRPHIQPGLDLAGRESVIKALLDQYWSELRITRPALWFYSPMMWPLARDLDASVIIYDCMDELANFRFAPPELAEREPQLMQAADLVFTGGRALHAAKVHWHDNIHPFPSGVDVAHFRAARGALPEPADQVAIPGPKLGYFGVIDERLDLELLRKVANVRPGWAFIMIGPVVKIAESDLPRLPNIHWLGQRDYDLLPAYLAGWDVALMPFAINEATRFISPTKTPEYLAGGKPVVSTPIADVIADFAGAGDAGKQAVSIAADAAGFITSCERAMRLARTPETWLPTVDQMLARRSWDAAHAEMRHLIRLAEEQRAPKTPAPERFRAPGVRHAPAQRYDAVIAGAGFAGSVLAERLAAGSGMRVLVCERRDHIGGNAYDHHDAAGILVHRYGPHIFHTNSTEIETYLSRFTEWRPYEHRVLADLGDKRLPMPINRTTLNGLYGIDLSSDDEAEAFLAAQAEPITDIRNSRDVVVNQIGTYLYKTFFEGYTRKQWGLDPTELDKSVTGRLPTRTSTDDRYFLDRFQAMPRAGYTRMFERMLDHPLIDLALGTSFADLGPGDRAPLTFYTGPIDAYFECRFGALPYRSLIFDHVTLDKRRHQEVAVVNYPSESVPYTRVTEYKHLTGQVHRMTSISYEFACSEGDPFYPVPRPENQLLYQRYAELARQEPSVVFLGRLGSYRYYNMDQVVGQALALYRRFARQPGHGSAGNSAAAGISRA